MKMNTETSIKIAHITDIHIGEDDMAIRDVDVRSQFLKVLSSVVESRPDYLVLGGDLAAVNGEIAAYTWIREQLQKAGIPFLIIPGNHDDTENLTRIFDLQSVFEGGLCFLEETDVGLLVGLDSSKGSISESQLAWFNKKVGSMRKSILLFIHHPPLDCGCLFMDSKYPLENRQEVFGMLEQIKGICGIYCGHYHTEKSLFRSGISAFITPSTMHQISQELPNYHVSSKAPGWRLIEWKSQLLSSRVEYLDQKP
jgi:3',5'-cyclic-AMP phosphodiesterase